MTNHSDPTRELRQTAEPIKDVANLDPAVHGLEFPSAAEIISRASRTASPEPGRHRPWRAATGIAAAAAAAAFVFAGPELAPTGPDQVPPTPSANPSTSYVDAQAVLFAAAGASQMQDDPSRAPYFHVKSLQRFGSVESPREVWRGNGRPGVLDQDGVLAELPDRGFPAADKRLSWEALTDLPTDPRRLRTVLVGATQVPGRSAKWMAFRAAGDLLAESPLPPAQRSAVWRMLASLPGATSTTLSTDAVGRKGWTVSMAVPGEGRITYVVDPQLGELLEWRYVPAAADRVSSVITFLERGTAQEAPSLTHA